ncbi:hypothetical protein CK203_109763 [Vitis vinifera]|uniref:Ubiquitin-like protease family profile domain-containing protein n=1 Tax=Vitis vinifera TaxID=29760 RepID=A0A438DLM2_VITVI|nr:hypothetical protein CK203_109763 [Vitis vinifera]
MVILDYGDYVPHVEWTASTTSVVLNNLKANATSQVIMDRCRMYVDADILGHDLGTCDLLFIPVCENNHWHLHVVNFPIRRVEILSFLPLRWGNNISASTW